MASLSRACFLISDQRETVRLSERDARGPHESETAVGPMGNGQQLHHRALAEFR